jgi:hypothetical protein
MDERKQREWAEKYRAAAQTKVGDEQVLAASIFYRTGSWGATAAYEVIPVVGTIARMVGKKKAAGFPQNFLIAATPTNVYAYKYKPSGFGVKVGDRLAAWDRQTLSVSAKKTGLTTRVVLDSPGDPPHVEADTGKGSFSDEIVGYLTDASKTT